MKRSIAFCLSLFTLGYLLTVWSDTVSGNDGKLIRSSDPIPGRYIVVLDPKMIPDSISEWDTVSTVYQMAGEFQVSVDNVYTSVLRGFAGEMTEKSASELSRDPRILFVEEDSYTYPSGVQSASDWGLDRIDQRDLPLNGAFMYAHTGVGVHVYVIDSGIRPTHQDFGGRATIAFDALNDGQNGWDCTGHGTHVAGTIGSATYGVAKNANLYGVRVLPCSGPGLVSNMISGINWVNSNRISPAVINMSINVSTVSNALNTAIQNTVANGIPFIASAGNNANDACLYSPGASPSAFIVGATASNDQRAPYSNYGGCVDLFAPGNGITSLGHTSDTGTRVMSGTSMATPMVTGAAALYLETNPMANPQTVYNRILLDATPDVITNIDTVSPNKLLYTWLGDAQPPTPASVTIIKEVQTLDGGTASTSAFTYSATNLGPAFFTLVDNDEEPADRFTNSGVFLFDAQNTITVVEATNNGWMLTSIDCVETPGEGFPNVENTTIDLANRKADIIVEEGETVVCTFRSIQLAPTSAPASVSGRIATESGAGVRGIRLTIENAFTGEKFSSTTNSFGYYMFDGISTSHFYVISVNGSKRYFFTPESRTFTLDDNISGMDFQARYRND
ncbi:MAG TPA: S8 family serine peptidase [Pyrinomonadaceae bacterium]|nr:S8 family serine peptidase [Pyrinomonadaceae bacterium]HMP66169.1 S8 family serine peptidase [Pyrinomonadaceae bacterium]